MRKERSGRIEESKKHVMYSKKVMPESMKIYKKLRPYITLVATLFEKQL